MVYLHDAMMRAKRRGSSFVNLLSLLCLLATANAVEDALLEAIMQVEPLRACPQSDLEIQGLRGARLELIDNYHRVVGLATLSK